ncbi:hypothetical protein LEP1GSC103_1304 [Leptospira borgpetersenii serovar Javanica str. UI 09931]|uniref:Uncharacterized protein n=2 Tax=Leptospira borgpetersenii TaxID=174 RepID=M3HN42_LEPBO|nr:hypothetical protein LEP1GSC101_2192 [Leptospira borgpetersenii str. UI 09149]EMF99044.1 hypothetical protein LEP1GSC123_0160 [Leptospira borgpetersenii str. 200701203]EMN57920.1 hypothetical protein LEP1GSC090_0505 [Leptospira borgpetersenii serovar Javanica str. MK146]EMO11083.1 hypothetical protein LEP1GSC137_4084 [Leptospira borgpetersenii str. Noumea 25]EPG56237.1 hypothetical protein LEP1GSC103_1304 [Leptospira borgpetersenii serovar Javanica str. UI 09931]
MLFSETFNFHRDRFESGLEFPVTIEVSSFPKYYTNCYE